MSIGIAARHTMIGQRVLGYIDDGLVAMWDGIWNVDIGIHDTSATTWNDLTGNYPGISVGQDVAKAYFNENSLYRTTSAGTLTTTLPPVQVGHTREILIKAARLGTYFRVSGDYRLSLDWGGSNNYPRIYRTMPSGGTGSVQLGWDAYSRASDGVWAIVLQIPSNNSLTIRENTCARSYTVSVGTSYYAGAKLAFGATTTQDCCGHIYCIRDYNRILSVDEIAYNYAIDKVRFNLP